MKKTAVECLEEQLDSFLDLHFSDWMILNKFIDQAKEMEKEQSQIYAEFAVMCDRKEIPILEFEEFIKHF